MTYEAHAALEVLDREELKDSPSELEEWILEPEESELEDVTEDPLIKLHNWFPRVLCFSVNSKGNLGWPSFIWSRTIVIRCSAHHLTYHFMVASV